MSDGIIIAIDAGTTGVRAFAVDTDGAPVGRSYREFTQHFPQPGWVEHDAAEIWTTTRAIAGRPLPHNPATRRTSLSSITSFERDPATGAWAEVDYQEPAAGLLDGAIDTGAV